MSEKVPNREGVVGVLRAQEIQDNPFVFLPLPLEDFAGKKKAEKILLPDEETEFEVLVPGMLSFISGGVKVPAGERITEENRQAIHTENFIREAKTEFEVAVRPEQLGSDFSYILETEQKRNGDTFHFLVWMFANVLINGSQIETIEKSVAVQTDNQHKIEVVSPNELARFLENNAQRLRPVARDAMRGALVGA